MNVVTDLTRRRKAREDGAPITRRRDYSKTCRHLQAVVDDVARTVTCDDCGAELDPIAVLESLAQNHDRYAAARDRAKQEAKQAEERLAELRRQEKNAKARARRRA